MKRWILRVTASLLAVIVITAVAVYTQLPEKIGEIPPLQTELFRKPAAPVPVAGTYIYRPAHELAELIKSGKATSTDIVKEHLAHIKNENWKYNAVVWLREEEALAEAAEADRKVLAGDTLQPLLGVPVTVKEQFGVKGLPSTLNAKRLGIIAERDAAAVAHIKRAGAILLGTTNLSYMVSFNETFGEVYPTGNNPYDTSRTPGGSTGGGAAALAAGFSPLSLGGDAGGSVRIPAAFCGLYGFKPSFGAVNITEGVMPFEIMKGSRFGIAHAGIMARTAADLSLYWSILKTTPLDRRFQKEILWPKVKERPLDDYTIAWTDQWAYDGRTVRVDNDVKQKLQQLIGTLKESDATVTEGAPDTYEEMQRLWGGMLFQITTQDENWLVRKITKLLISKMDNGEDAFNEIYASLNDNSPERWESLLHRQKVMIAEVDAFFNRYDFLVLPLTYGPAFTKCNAAPFLKDDDGNDMHYLDYFPYTGIFNASGHPAAVVPMGLNADGLPVGLQIVAGMYRDDELMHFLELIEPGVPGFVKPGSGLLNLPQQP